MSTETAKITALGKRPTNTPPMDGNVACSRRKTFDMDFEFPSVKLLTTDDEASTRSPRSESCGSCGVETPKTPMWIAEQPAFDLSEWVSAFNSRQWTKNKPAPTSDRPTKVLLPRGNNPLPVAQKVIAARTFLSDSQSKIQTKYNLDYSKYNGLLVLDCDKTILHNDTDKKKCYFRKGLGVIFRLCKIKKLAVCLLSTASRRALDKYKEILENSFHTSIDLAYSMEDHSAMLSGIAIGNGLFMIKVLSHFFTEETLKRTAFVDDMLAQLCLQPENSFLVTEFHSDVADTDRQLVHLAMVLDDIFSHEGDLRPLISAKNGMMPLINVITQSLNVFN